MNKSINENAGIKKFLVGVIILHVTLKIYIGVTTSLGNDEVYYWLYAMFPDWSHFDHPPLVGVLIQIFTLNLALDYDVMIRLGGIVLGVFNCFIIYKFISEIRTQESALYAVIAYQASIYTSFIAGLFILPDTPQITFWLLGIYFTYLLFIKNSLEHNKRLGIWVLFGLFLGLCILSKYHAVLLIGGVGLYCLLFSRKKLFSPLIFIPISIIIVSLLPIILWNYNNDFISFTYHQARMMPQLSFNSSGFAREILGQVVYQNPFVFIICIFSMITFVKRARKKVATKIEWLLICVSIPIIFCFVMISTVRDTLPHWSGPGYIGLILLSGYYFPSFKFKSLYKYGWGLMCLLAVLFPVFVNNIPLNLGSKKAYNLGEFDFTQDIYGWDLEKDSVRFYLNKYEKNNLTLNKTDIVAEKWFPAAHIDRYIATPLGRQLFCVGVLKDIHKYAWINRDRKGLKVGGNYYFLRHSNHPIDVENYFESTFKEIVKLDKFTIYRSGVPMRDIQIYLLKSYNGNANDLLSK